MLSSPAPGWLVFFLLEHLLLLIQTKTRRNTLISYLDSRVVQQLPGNRPRHLLIPLFQNNNVTGGVRIYKKFFIQDLISME
jgi:hypothetical protein